MPNKNSTGLLIFSILATITFGCFVSFMGIESIKFAVNSIIRDDSSYVVGFSRAIAYYREIENKDRVIENDKPKLGIPTHLYIPKIGVDAKIESIDSVSQGKMDVPSSHINAGWWTSSPIPGENGDAIIDGHYGWKDKIPAVFDNLDKLTKGDKIYVEDAKGVSVTFVVRETRVYNEKDYASDVYDSNGPGAHLNLITCGGSWDNSKQSYSKRLVVFADRERI
jgi:LPXTG-site transpeptidase (sortase) family protein